MYSSQLVLSFSLLLLLLLSLPLLLLLLASHVLPPPRPSLPISPQDELDDLSLFTRASTYSHRQPPPHHHNNKPSRIFHLSSSFSSSSYRTKPTPKIAFLFLTNTDLHFSPLWNLFFLSQPRSLFNIYVHADPSSDNLTRHPNGVFTGRFIPSKLTARASPTLISATRRLLAHALLDDPENAYFALLSQHCIPLRSFPYVYRSLFLSTTFDSSSSTESTRPLQKSFIEILTHAPNLWQRYTSRGRFAMLPEVPYEEFRVGSQFFTITRRHALMVVRDRALWRKFRVACYSEDECYPEEHYFPTLLSMQDPGFCTNYTLTRVNWTGTVNGHPYSYRGEEVSAELIHRLRESNYSDSYLFARKFTPDCLEPLMRIAKSVIFRD